MNWRYIPVFAFVTLATFVLHEGAHWAIGEALGYDMWVRVNSAGLVTGDYVNDWHRSLVSIAGPVVTIAQGVIGYILVWVRRSYAAFIVLFTALMMRVLASVVSLNNLNDEARVSEAMGMNMWVLPGVVVGSLLLLTIFAGVKLRLGWRSWIFCWIAASLCLMGVVLSEPWLPTLGAA